MSAAHFGLSVAGTAVLLSLVQIEGTVVQDNDTKSLTYLMS